MSNRDPDARYETLPQAVPFVTSQLLKQVHTTLPAVVERYDAETRRARVQPAVDLMLSPIGSPNAGFSALEPMPYPILLDVPVIFPSGGGYTMHFPLLPDDPVLLLFSERDIKNFKETLLSGPPASDAIMEIQHVVALPGFVFPNGGGVMIPPPDIPPGMEPDWIYGATVQTNDGKTFIHLAAEPNEIHARIVGDPVSETTYARLTPQRIYATPDNETTYVDIKPERIEGSPDTGVTYARIEPSDIVATPDMDVTHVRIRPADIDATPDSGVTSVHIRPGDILATPDNDVTHARLRPADVDVTVDSGTTLFRVTGGDVAITATTITITGMLNVTGDLAVSGTSTLTGDVLPGANVEGVDVGTHTHGDGTLRIGSDSVTGDTGQPN